MRRGGAEGRVNGDAPAPHRPQTSLPHGPPQTSAEFVMQGRDKGYVEIELYDPGPNGNITIRRTLKRGSESSVWKLNGERRPSRFVTCRVRLSPPFTRT